ncbi:MAG: sigma-54 dependent transcriptional regulator [Thermodesulfobacterium sp.]|nr:sigma-54 dependent transcriptional regulator [Thermodesulfobacterium sp.]
MKKGNILIVEDDKAQRELLAEALRKRGFYVEGAENLAEAKELLEKRDFNVLLLDYKLPDGDGLEFLAYLKKNYPNIPTIMLTAYASVENAVSAMKAGAFHYLAKPLNLEELNLIVDKALKENKLIREISLLRERFKFLSDKELKIAENIVAESPAMKKVLSLVSKVAETDAPVLITGESGTGKGVIARLIHQLSPAKEGPFLQINCAAIPETLLEAELFGYERGAFTGATHSKAGLFELAEGGTLFLDEIGDMPLSLQAKLLTVLQDKTIRRLGGLKEIKVNFRFISATNQDLEKMVEEGKFREDLFWRLNVIRINIPPLRERKEDIIPLAQHFIKKFNQKYRKEVQGLTQEAMLALLRHDFPGNVRELENRIERGIILAEDEYLTREDLGLAPEGQREEDLLDKLLRLPLEEAVEFLERLRIERALKEAKGVKVRAAEILGITERMLRYKIEKYGLGG